MANWKVKRSNRVINPVNKGSINYDAAFYKDDVLYKTHSFVGVSLLDEKSLEKIERDQINEWTRVDSLDPMKVKEEVVYAEIVPPTPKEPTQAELDQNAYFVALNRLESANRMVAAGVIKDSDKVYTDLLADAKGKFKAEYIG